MASDTIGNVIKIKIFNKVSLDKIKYEQSNEKGFDKGESYEIRDGQFTFPLLEDVAVSAKSNMSTIGELVPWMGILKKGVSIFSSMSGDIDAGAINFINKMDSPRWENTEPFRLNLKIRCYLKTNAALDVVMPARILQEQSILTQHKGKYITPGISLQSFAAFSKVHPTEKSRNIAANTKLVEIDIPGIIRLPFAIVESAIPTYSKETTTSNAPIYADIDLQVISILPASTEYFLNTGEIKESVDASVVEEEAQAAAEAKK